MPEATTWKGSTESEANAKKSREEYSPATEGKTDQVQMSLSAFLNPDMPDIIPTSGVFSYRKLYYNLYNII